MSYEEFVKFSIANDLENVTQDEFKEYVEGKLWSNSRAVTMIRNARKKKESDADKHIEVLVGYPLGGRDFVYKGIQWNQAKSQLIPLLLPDGEILELTQFGEFKGKHFRKCEVEIEVTEKTGTERTFTNRIIRSVRIMDDKMDLPKIVSRAKPFFDITENDKYEYLVLHGVVDHFDKEPIFQDGVKTGYQEHILNNKPVFNYVMKNENKWVRVSLSPSKHCEHVLEVPDLDQIAHTESTDMLTNAFAGERFLAVGIVKRYDYADKGDFINVDATAIFLIPEGTTLPDSPKTIHPAPIAKSEPIGTSKPETTKQGSFSSESAKQALDKLEKSLHEGREILGQDFSVQGCRDLGLIPESIPDPIIEKMIKDKAI